MVPIWSLGEPALPSFCRAFSTALRDPLLVKRLQQIVDGVDFKCFHGVLVEGRRENDLRQSDLLVEQLLDHTEAIETRHLHVEEHEVGRELLDQVHGLDAILALRHDVNIHLSQQVGQLVTRKLLVIDNDRRNRHSRSQK